VEDSYKRACKNEAFKFGKRFTINRFPKIKEAFTVKLKMISVNHYFLPHQTPENVKIIFQKTFYAEQTEDYW
jgi:hypothetical protein